MQHSVVIPVLINDNKQLSMTLKCINLAREKTKIPFELVIVESNTQYLIDYADVYINDKNSTSEKSHNRGFKVASGEYVTLLTNDVYVSDGWLESLLECFKIEDCGCSTLASTQFNHKKENKIEEGNWWSVCMIKNELFRRTGYYDERFDGSWSDTDLLVEIYKLGKKMYRNFNCVVEHLGGQTLYSLPGHFDKYEAGKKLFNKKHEALFRLIGEVR